MKTVLARFVISTGTPEHEARLIEWLRDKLLAMTSPAAYQVVLSGLVDECNRPLAVALPGAEAEER